MGGQGVEKGLDLAMICNQMEPMDVMITSFAMSFQAMRSQWSRIE